MNPHTVSLVTTFLCILAAAIGGAVLSLKARQSSVIGYIAGGFIVGNLLVSTIDHSLVSLIAEAGVTLLLFTLGVEFSFRKLRAMLSLVSWGAIGQILITTIVILLLLLGVGAPFVPAIFLAAAAALSSTAIVVKLLSERGELDSVPGGVATGWLVIQDLAVVPMLILLTSLTKLTSGDATVISVIAALCLSIVKAGAILMVTIYLGRFGIPKVLSAVSSFRSRELLLLTTVGIVFFFGLLTMLLGLSVSLGAFLAGLIVSETSQNHAVFSEIRPLRDLFAVVFFVSLGMSLPLAVVTMNISTILLISGAVVLLKGFIIFFLLRMLGYHRKTAVLVGVYLTQISEFGFVLAQTGMGLKAITSEHAAILIASTFLTIIISSPLITHAHRLYYFLAKHVFTHMPRLFPFRPDESLPADPGLSIEGHVVICGYGRVGKYIGRALQMVGVPFLVVDYNNHTLLALRNSGIQTVYGDPADKDVLDYAQVDKARLLIVAIPDRHTQELVIANAQSLNRRITIVCRTHHEEDQQYLKALGVQTIIQPEFEAAVSIVSKVLPVFGASEEDIAGKVQRLKIEHGMG